MAIVGIDLSCPEKKIYFKMLKSKRNIIKEPSLGFSICFRVSSLGGTGALYIIRSIKIDRRNCCYLPNIFKCRLLFLIQIQFNTVRELINLLKDVTKLILKIFSYINLDQNKQTSLPTVFSYVNFLQIFKLMITVFIFIEVLKGILKHFKSKMRLKKHLIKKYIYIYSLCNY